MHDVEKWKVLWQVGRSWVQQVRCLRKRVGKYPTFQPELEKDISGVDSPRDFLNIGAESSMKVGKNLGISQWPRR
jgi:hypothetical protein